MGSGAAVPIERRIYDLGNLLARICYLAEAAWCSGDDFEGVHFQRLGVAKVEANGTTEAIEKEFAAESAANCAHELRAKIEQFWSQYRKEFSDEERQRILSETDDVDPGLELDCRCYLVKHSPVNQSPWVHVNQAAEAFSQSLDCSFRGCFDLGKLLGAEVYPTVTGGQYLRERDEELAYFVHHLGPQLRQAVDATKEDFPQLANVNIDFSNETVLGAKAKIERLNGTFADLLGGTSQAPGYLGLVLDRPRGTVRRGERNSPLRRAQTTRWNLLLRLEGGGAEGCKLSELETALKGGRAEGPSSPAIDRAISDLNGVLRPLGLQIKSDRGVAKKIVEIET